MTTACPRCGHDNPDDALLCGTCRAYLGWARRAHAADPASPPASPPAAPVAPPAPIAVPHDRAAAPRPVQVPAAAPAPRAPRPTTPRSATPPPTGRSTWTPPASAPAPAAPEPPPGRSTPSGGPAPVQVSLGPSAPRTARPDARSAPPRTIGVRVAAGPARIDPQRPAGPDVAAPARTSSFEALQPTAAQGEAVTGQAPPAAAARPRPSGSSTPVFEDAVRCPSCGHALPASRRFCRCGATLAPPPALVEDDPAPAAPWYRRAAGSGASFRRRMRAANHGVRVVFDRGRAAQVHVARAAAALAAVGLAGVVALPQTSDVRDRAYAAVQQVDPRGYTRVAGVTATTDPPPADATAPDPAAPDPAAPDPTALDPAAPDPAAPDPTAPDPTASPTGTPAQDLAFGPQNAVDGATGRAWSVPWAAPADAGPPCGRPGGAPALVLTLPAPTAVDRVGLVAGLPASAPDRARQAVPALVDVTWLPSGTCTTLELTDTPDLQTQDVADVRDATSARVVVVDVHLPQDPPADLRVAVAEVLLLSQGRAGPD